jgi:AcrR family transcriptional regulator
MRKTPTYHHGALRDALLAAAEKLLRQKGLSALTLRATAREAQVSHGAPAHHFADLSALLSALAAAGFRRLVDALGTAADARGRGPQFPVAHAYVSFAMANPALFSLMFREERLNARDPALREARGAAFATLAELLGASTSGLTMPELGAMTAVWSLTHGFAVLAVDGRLAPLLRSAPEGTDVLTLLDAALENLLLRPVRRRSTKAARR